MNKSKFVAIAGVALSLTLALGSCAKPPVAEMDAATAAVSRAEGDADVVAYAADSLKRAKDSLARMQGEADAKRYDAAKTLALETVQAAEKAIGDGKTGKERAKQTATDLSGTIKASLIEAENALAGARKTRGVRLDFAGIGAEITEAKNSVAAFESDFNSGNYRGAIQKGETLRSKLADIINRISEAVRAASKKK
ncbi:MAG: hypothetical protein A2Z99_00865 [Treponema sp. GWB1_62_6]|nr:MAG: hypothetical protein A2Z99_00865 [Treponema sp. GWB1_62_6]OHE69300.1 MAG: hypothetical protein A2001_12500 [Treponema sp. GWC1_61_84]OHE70295.1 MAG: hypothetical protein A2413_14180 [Treponema sp. RIFOXYC1_FULL_61_9]HCM26287.1 hypothetical protein [Treponema sp.]